MRPECRVCRRRRRLPAAAAPAGNDRGARPYRLREDGLPRWMRQWATVDFNRRHYRRHRDATVRAAWLPHIQEKNTRRWLCRRQVPQRSTSFTQQYR